jgi:hypothetical protein
MNDDDTWIPTLPLILLIRLPIIITIISILLHKMTMTKMMERKRQRIVLKTTANSCAHKHIHTQSHWESLLCVHFRTARIIVTFRRYARLSLSTITHITLLKVKSKTESKNRHAPTTVILKNKIVSSDSVGRRDTMVD